MANTKYKYENSLPACKVDRFLLESIEDYLFDKVPELIKTTKKNLNERLSIRIYDKFGEEEINSISEYSLRTFPDDIQKININLSWNDYNKGESLRIWIAFDKESAKLTVEIEGKNPKEITTGLVNSIKAIVNQNKTLNRIFHLPFILSSIFISIGLLSFWISTFLANKNWKYSILFLSISLVIGMYFWAFKKLKPYSSFDTIRQAKIDKTANWFFYALLTFVVFGNLFVFLQKQMFG